MLKKHVSGFDYLRAFFSILVVIWHDKNIPYIMGMQSDIRNIVEIFYYNICLLAVPIFFQISLFLFYKKQETNHGYFLEKKLPDLLIVYSIWMSIGLTIDAMVTKGSSLLELASIKKIILMLIAGSRPELYFLFSLILITFIAFLNHRYLLNTKNSIYIQLILLGVSSIAILSLDTMAIVTHKYIFSAPWNPICFLPYVFSSSILLALDRDNRSDFAIYFYKKRFRFIATLLAVFLLLSSLEWYFINSPTIVNNHELLPMYARTSLIFGTFIICYCAILHVGKSSNLIKEISQESLSIYLMHRYILQFFQYLNYSLDIIFNPVIRIALATIVPIFIAKFLKKHHCGRIMLNASYKSNYDSRQSG